MKNINLLLLSLLCFIAFNVNAQWNQLTDPNLQGGEDEEGFVITSDSSVLIATDGGIFKSTNKGASWNYSSNGLDSLSNEIRGITEFNSNIYILDDFSNLYITLNNGDSWTKITENGIPPYSWTMSLGSANNLLFGIIGAGDSISIYFSFDGTNWSPGAYLGNNFNSDNELLHLSNDSMYICKNDSLFYTIDGTSVIPMSLNGLGIDKIEECYALTEEPNENYLYYNREDSIFRYNSNLQLWQPIDNGLGKFIMIEGLKAVDDNLFVTTIDSLFNMKLYHSTDHGDTWTEISDPGMEMPMIEKIIKVGLNNLVCFHMFGEIYYSNDNGSTWTLGNTGFFARDNSDLKAVNNTLLTSKGEYGIIRSTDNGQTWNLSNNGIPSFIGVLHEIKQTFNIKDTVFVTVNKNLFSDSTFLYKSIDQGENWYEVTNTPDSVNCLFAGKNNSTLFVKFGSCYYKTSDGGTSWTNITPVLSTLNLSDIYVFSGKGDSLLLFAKKTNNEEAIFLSTDNADNWTDLSDGAVGTNMEFKILYKWDDRKAKLVMNYGGTENRPLIVISDKNCWPRKDYLYELCGSTWQEINTTGLPSTLDIQDIAYHDAYWYVSDIKGVFRSDNSIDWQPVRDNTDLYMGMQGYSIQFIDNNIFLGTSHNSTWTTSLPVGINHTGIRNNNINIYPNPCSSDFTIELKNNNPVIVKMFTLYGQKIFEKTYSDINKGNNKINIKLNNIPAGVYLIKINNSINKLVITK